MGQFKSPQEVADHNKKVLAKMRELDYGEIMEQINAISTRLVIAEPFYGHFFGKLTRCIVEQIPTLAIIFNDNNNKLKLGANPLFWHEVLKDDNETTTRNWRYGGIKHELLHVIMGHPFIWKEYNDKQVLNIAADLVVNQLIEKHQTQKAWVHYDQFPDFFDQSSNSSDRNQSVGFYYKKLMKEWKDVQKNQKQQQGQCGQGQGEGEGEEQDGDGKGQGQQGKPGQGSGGQGSGDGSDPSQQQGKGGSGATNKSQERLEDLLGNGEDTHATWTEIGDLSEGAQEFIKSQINRDLVEVGEQLKNSGDSRDWGSIPGKIREMIEELQRAMKPSVNWKKTLKLFTTSSSKTRIKSTIRRPSKRYGTTPGTKLQKKQRICIAIDTSGSVSIPDLVEFFSEMRHIWKQGADIMIVECDTQIGRIWQYKGKPPDGVSGRGGTYFDPPIEWNNQNYRADCLIYFTDGWAPAPTVKSCCPVLWMVCSKGDPKYADFESTKGHRVVAMKAEWE